MTTTLEKRNGFFLLGTGPSSGVPQLQHVIGQTRPGAGPCKVCLEAVRDPDGPNYRNNICAMVCINEAEPSFHLIDMGKTFRNAALKWFPRLGVKRIHSLVISHDHADASGGLDDIREIQGPFQYTQQDDGHVVFSSKNKLTVYLSSTTMKSIRKSYSYIVEASEAESAVERKVAMCDFVTFESLPNVRAGRDDQQLLYGHQILGGRIRMELLPVYHGGTYVCMGFAFKGLNSSVTDIVFISDASRFPKETITAIDALMPIDTLVIDSLFYKNPHFSHLCVEEALDFVSRWRPRQTLLVGCSCRSDWQTTNEHLTTRVVPSMRQGKRVPEFEPPLDRPRETSKMLAEIPVPSTQPELSNIETIQIARDGIFVPCDW